MEFFWNEGPKDTTQGLDVLGIRGLDQALERRWVASLTTISIRARYMSLLAWFLAGYYRRLARTSTSFDGAVYGVALARLEFLSAAATELHGPETGDTYGTLGKDVFSTELRTIRDSSRSVALPDRERITMAATYFNPAAGFGLLVANPEGSSVPSALLPRGTEIADARDEVVPFKDLESVLFDGGKINRSSIEQFSDALAINRLSVSGREAAALRMAVLQPPMGVGHETRESYGRFQATVRWALNQASASPFSAGAMIQSAVRLSLNEPSQATDVEHAWSEYEIHRLAHYGYELVLGAVVASLSARPMPLASIFSEWRTDMRSPEILVPLLRSKALPWSTSLSEYANRIAPEELLANRLAPRIANSLSPAPKAAYGLSLVLAANAMRQSINPPIGDQGLAIRRETMHCIRDVFASCVGESFGAFAEAFASREVISRHLENTFRKMSAGMKSSLRLYTDGDNLHPTDQGQWASFSGGRLDNVLQVLSDIGLMQRHGSGFQTTAIGNTAAAALEKA